MQLGHSLDGSRNDLRRDVNSRWALQTRWSPKAGLIALPVFLTWLEIRAVLRFEKLDPGASGGCQLAK